MWTHRTLQRSARRRFFFQNVVPPPRSPQRVLISSALSGSAFFPAFNRPNFSSTFSCCRLTPSLLTLFSFFQIEIWLVWLATFFGRKDAYHHRLPLFCSTGLCPSTRLFWRLSSGLGKFLVVSRFYRRQQKVELPSYLANASWLDPIPFSTSSSNPLCLRFAFESLFQLPLVDTRRLSPRTRPPLLPSLVRSPNSQAFWRVTSGLICRFFFSFQLSSRQLS